MKRLLIPAALAALSAAPTFAAPTTTTQVKVAARLLTCATESYLDGYGRMPIRIETAILTQVPAVPQITMKHEGVRSDLYRYLSAPETQPSAKLCEKVEELLKGVAGPQFNVMLPATLKVTSRTSGNAYLENFLITEDIELEFSNGLVLSSSSSTPK